MRLRDCDLPSAVKRWNEQQLDTREIIDCIRPKHLKIGPQADSKSHIYGAMHFLDSDHNAMERYTRAYKCDEKQGLIANLSADLALAIDRLELRREDCSLYRETIAKVDETLRRPIAKVTDTDRQKADDMPT